jgi:hypothetical protein
LLHGSHHHAIPAVRYAGGVGERAIIARINRTISAATIVVSCVAVVTGFTAFDGSVTARNRGALADTARRANATFSLDLAVARATIAFLGVAVVADLVERGAYRAIATPWSCFAGRPGLWTDPACLELTTGAASVTRGGNVLAVVAVLTGLDALVAAL